MSDMIKIIKKQPASSYWLMKYKNSLTDLIGTLYSLYTFKKGLKNVDLNNPSPFRSIGIETYNRCNNDCPFCPANMFFDKRTPVFMKEQLFSSIIQQLKEFDYQGIVTLSINDEPLLDNRLEKFVKISTRNLQNSEVKFWTNGKLLNLKRLKSLYKSGLRSMTIDNYNDRLELLPNIKNLLKQIKGTEMEKNISINVWLRYKNVVLDNRAGLSPNGNKTNWLIRMRKCGLPFIQFNVNPEGKAFICCLDAYYQNIVGDLNKESIMEIWRGKKLKDIRKNIISSGRKNIFPCKRCDTLA